jgi:hypothetical protein
VLYNPVWLHVMLSQCLGIVASCYGLPLQPLRLSHCTCDKLLEAMS